MTAEVKCPVCGSTELDTADSPCSYTPPFGVEKKYSIKIDTCKKCKESGDFHRNNDVAIIKAHKEADLESVDLMIKHLVKVMPTIIPYLERVLGLPFHSTDKWKKEITPAELALLRIIRAFPWILMVACDKFSQVAIRREMYYLAIRLARGKAIEWINNKLDQIQKKIME